MEISKQGIENIKDIRVDYENKQKVFDRKFLDEVLRIVKREEEFRDKIKVVFDKRGFGLTAYVEEDEIHFVVANLVKDCFLRARVWVNQFENTRLVEIQNLYAIYAVLHECTHIWQTFGCNRDQEVNRLYQDLFKKTEDLSLYQTFLYNYKSLEFSFERNAILEGFRETVRIYDGSDYREVAESNYMFLIDDYGYGNPVAHTLKMLKLKNNYDFSDVSIFEKLEHGIIVDRSVLKEAQRVSVEYAKKMIDFDEGIVRLKKLK